MKICLLLGLNVLPFNGGGYFHYIHNVIFENFRNPTRKEYT